MKPQTPNQTPIFLCLLQRNTVVVVVVAEKKTAGQNKYPAVAVRVSNSKSHRLQTVTDYAAFSCGIWIW